MGGFDFTANIISSLAWPLAVLVLIVVFRVKIETLFDAIIKKIPDVTEVSASAKGVSAKLEKHIENLADQTETLPEPVPRDENLFDHPTRSAWEFEDHLTGVRGVQARRESFFPRIPPPFPDAEPVVTKYQRLAVENPKAAVLAAFSDLEVLLRRLYEQRLGVQGRFVSFGKIVDDLQRVGELDETVSQWLREVSEIRNEIAHSDATVNQAMADAYIRAVGNLIGYMILVRDTSAEDQPDTSKPTDDDGGESNGKPPQEPKLPD